MFKILLYIEGIANSLTYILFLIRILYLRYRVSGVMLWLDLYTVIIFKYNFRLLGIPQKRDAKRSQKGEHDDEGSVVIV